MKICYYPFENNQKNQPPISKMGNQKQTGKPNAIAYIASKERLWITNTTAYILPMKVWKRPTGAYCM